jgi:hypothetical protein
MCSWSLVISSAGAVEDGGGAGRDAAAGAGRDAAVGDTL